MRTPGSGVAEGRWGRSLVAGGLSKALSVYSVAVLLCCTVLGRVIMRHGLKSRINSLSLATALILAPSISGSQMWSRSTLAAWVSCPGLYFGVLQARLCIPAMRPDERSPPAPMARR